MRSRPAPLAAAFLVVAILASLALARLYRAPAPTERAPLAPRTVTPLTDGRPVDVNHASGEELQLLPRIGPRLAERIIAERERQPFRSLDELSRVRGIGPRTVEGLRGLAEAGP